jgi:hypothetical protein
MKNALTEERFWARVDHSDPDACWIWPHKESPFLERCGYGIVCDSGRTYPAHRRAYMFAHGSIPDGMVVMHSCDRHYCVNPAHLKLGTQKDNMQDMVAKGRNRSRYAKKATA